MKSTLLLRKLLRSLLLCGLFAVATGSAVAQAPATVFAPAGAVWWYRTTDIGGPGYERCFVDTVFADQGRTVSRVRVERWDGYPTGPMQVTFRYGGIMAEKFYFYTQGAQVYYYASSPASARLLYDFDLPVGTTWPLVVGCSNSDSAATVTVDSVASGLLGGQLLRYQVQRARLNSNNFGTNIEYAYGDRLWEQLGYPNARFVPQPMWDNCEPTVYLLLAYRGAGLSVGTVPQIPLAVAADHQASPFSFAPNPSATGRYTWAGLTQALPYTVLDPLGRTVATGTATPAQPALDLSTRPTGVYMLRAATPDGRTVTHRLVRE